MGPTGRWFTVASLVETVSLPILVLNRVTAHSPVVTSTVGPLHGFAYLTVIALALTMTCPGRLRALAFVPAIGGVLFIAGYGHAQGANTTGGSDNTPGPP